MATKNLSASANWSAFKSGMADGDTIMVTGTYALTFDETPTIWCVFDSITNAVSGTLAIGAPSSITLPNWQIKAGAAAQVLTVGAGKALVITGTLTVTGGNAAAKYGVNLNGGTINGNIVATSGSNATAYGFYLTTGTMTGNIEAHGGAGVGAYLVGGTMVGTLTCIASETVSTSYGARISANYPNLDVVATGASAIGCYGARLDGAVRNITGNGGAYNGTAAAGVYLVNPGVVIPGTTVGNANAGNGAPGVVSYSVLATVDAHGGGGTNAIGIQSFGAICGGTSAGGTVAWGDGIRNYGGACNVTCSGTTPDAVGLRNFGVARLDSRQLSGYAVDRTSGALELSGGGSQTAVAGIGGTVATIPAPSNVLSSSSVLGEAGTASSGVPAGFLRKMMDRD